MNLARKFLRWVCVTENMIHGGSLFDMHTYDALMFQDANTIKKIFAQKKSEMEHGEPIKSSIRIR